MGGLVNFEFCIFECIITFIPALIFYSTDTTFERKKIRNADIGSKHKLWPTKTFE